MKIQATPVNGAIAALLLGLASSAHAQSAPAKAESQLETVVVTGIRASLQQAINVKRRAEAHVDVITAEDIGKMPDKNVADSLARVPGVSVLNSPAGGSGGFDERDRVGLRGTNPSLTQTLLDGHGIANGDWFVLDQTGAGVGRSVSYALLPSELVARVEVRKSSEASLVEGGTAGSVNVITRRPLDFAKPLTFEAGIGAVYADLPKKTDPQLSALLNFRNEAKTFGLLVQAFSEKRSLRRDGVETLGFINQLTKANAPLLVAARPDLEGVYVPDLIGSAYFTQERERQGGLVRAQFRPTKELDLQLTAFTSKMDADNYNRNYLIAPRPGLINGATISNYQVATDKNGVKTLAKATFDWASPSTAGYYDMISRKASAETGFVSLDGTLKVSDALVLNASVGNSNGKGKTLSQDVVELAIRTNKASFGLNGSDAAPSFSFNNPSMGADWIFGTQNVVVHDKESWAQLDGEYTLDSGVLRSLKFGARQAQHKRYTDATVNQGPGCATGTPYRVGGFDWSKPSACADANGKDAPALSPFTSLPALSSSYPSNFGTGLGSGFPTNIGYIPADSLAAYNAKFANRDPIARRSPGDGGEYNVKETSTAAYLQGNLEGEGWSGNVGLRIVRTEQKSGSFRPSRPGETPTVKSLFGDFTATSSDRTYTDLLPSASLRVDVSKDVVGRLGLSRTITRADYTALSAFTSLNTTGMALDNTTVGGGTAGNADLKPIRSTNFDANLEWYFAPRSFVSVGAFHMEMSSYITDGTFTGTFPVLLSNTAPGSPQQLVNRQFVITGLTNKKASVTGLEFAFEMPVAANFGVNANYTLSNGHDEDGKVLRGNVKNTFNLGGFFENDTLSLRVNYSLTDDIFIGTDRATDYYQKANGVLSASFGYKISKQFAISLDAQNLNNPKLKYYASEVQPRAIYQNGRQFYLTARVKY